jgi:hypothetical protein
MVTVQVRLDDEVLTLLRAEAKARMNPVGLIVRVAVGGGWSITVSAPGAAQ